jgi:hypothetical protein
MVLTSDGYVDIVYNHEDASGYHSDRYARRMPAGYWNSNPFGELWDQLSPISMDMVISPDQTKHWVLSDSNDDCLLACDFPEEATYWTATIAYPYHDAYTVEMAMSPKNGQPHVTFYSSSTLYHAYRQTSGAWEINPSIVTFDQGGFYHDVAVDRTGTPHVVYNAGNSMGYARREYKPIIAPWLGLLLGE